MFSKPIPVSAPFFIEFNNTIQNNTIEPIEPAAQPPNETIEEINLNSIETVFIENHAEVNTTLVDAAFPPRKAAPPEKIRIIVNDIPTPDQYNDPEKLQNKLSKYIIPELKYISNHYKLHISGNKSTLIDRIQAYFKKWNCAIKIQKVWRGYIVKQLFALRGGGLYKSARKLSVNDTDFYSIEDVCDIPFYLYFSYRDEKGFLYSFNIESLILFISKNASAQTIQNPYTRENIPDEVMKLVYKYIRINHLFYPDIKLIDEGLYQMIYPAPKNSMKSDRGGGSDARKKHGENTVLHQIPNMNDFKNNLQQIAIINKIREIRIQSIETRINNLFIEIDLLGNYTQSRWFSELNFQNLIRYWNALYDIWLYRADILSTTKLMICPIYTPFFQKRLFDCNEAPCIEIVQDYCLYAMENMIYMSPNEEYRRLGATYVIMALTLVSREARMAFPWLYESITY